MDLRSDGTDAFLTDANLLVECRGADDWRLVGTSRLKDGVLGSGIRLR
jgi:hypothetical protein